VSLLRCLLFHSHRLRWSGQISNLEQNLLSGGVDRGLYCRDERSTGVSRSRTSVTVLKVRSRDFIYFILDHTLTESQATAHAAYQKNHLTFAKMRFDSDGHELTVPQSIPDTLTDDSESLVTKCCVPLGNIHFVIGLTDSSCARMTSAGRKAVIGKV